MKIIGFSASPRKDGNTAWTINKILEGAKEQGAETQIWYSSELDIKPCQSCFSCKKSDKGCIINDDMQQLYDAFENTDIIVLGSPVYMGQMSAQAKIFTDRLFPIFSPRFSPFFKDKNLIKKRLILVYTQGNPDSDLFKEYFNYTKKMFQILEFDVKDTVIVAGMRSESAHERKELHTTLKNIGSSLA